MRSVAALFLCAFMYVQFSPAQTKEFSSFIPKGYHLINTSGPGISNSSGDIILQLENKDESDYAKLILLRKTNNKIQKIGENDNLLMNDDMLGTSGSGSVSLDEKTLTVEYFMGSSSSQSSVMITFQKETNNLYYFREYSSRSRSYGVENLFNRFKISSEETGEISFSDAKAEKIQSYSKNKNPDNLENSPKTNQIIDKIKSYFPENYGIAHIAIGDLNLDNFKDDVFVLFVDYDSNSKAVLQILLEQKDKSYQLTASNNFLFTFDADAGPNFGYLGGLNFENIKLIIKNGFFTIEKRTHHFEDTDYYVENKRNITPPDKFIHQYYTFKYDPEAKNWFSYKYAVEHYQGANDPAGKTEHYSQKEIGKIGFNKIRNFPGYLYYEPEISTVFGTLSTKSIYGKPNYGATPDKDEKIMVYILKPEIPIQVSPLGFQDPETGNRIEKNIREIQLSGSNKNSDFKALLNQKIVVNGTLTSGNTGETYTGVIMAVKDIEN